MDLKIADAALGEMAEAFRIFRPYRGCARSRCSARRVPRRTTRSTAWPRSGGATLAGSRVDGGHRCGTGDHGRRHRRGRGANRAFGVNIRLPHEEGANPFIAEDPKLVEMRYFFDVQAHVDQRTHGYAVLPGGFGTQDECYELLTLLQTGKAEPSPVVLVETPGGSYWRGWERFLTEEAIAGWGVARGRLALSDRQLGRRGLRRDRRLLPQLPLEPLGWKPAGPPPRGGSERRPSWPI